MFEPLLMSKQIYDSLPEPAAKVIDAVGLEMEPFALQAAKADDEELINVYTKTGATIRRHGRRRRSPSGGRWPRARRGRIMRTAAPPTPRC